MPKQDKSLLDTFFRILRRYVAHFWGPGVVFKQSLCQAVLVWGRCLHILETETLNSLTVPWGSKSINNIYIL